MRPKKHFSPKSSFIETEIEKSEFLIKKKSTPNYPENLPCRALAPAVRQRRCALAPPNPDSFEKIEKKNVPKLHLVAIFCENKSETVTKHRVTRSKIAPFRLEYPKWRGFGKKSGILVFFGGFGAFRPPNSAKLFLVSPITAP